MTPGMLTEMFFRGWVRAQAFVWEVAGILSCVD